MRGRLCPVCQQALPADAHIRQMFCGHACVKRWSAIRKAGRIPVTVRLPFAPLETLASESTLTDLCEHIGIAWREVLRWRELGVRVDKADLVASRLGWHASSIWPEWELLHVEAAVEFEALQQRVYRARRAAQARMYRARHPRYMAAQADLAREARRQESPAATRARKAKSARWRAANDRTEEGRAYYEANREAILAKKRVHDRANAVAKAAAARRYYEANREACLAYAKEYARKNRDRRNAQRRVQRTTTCATTSEAA